MRILLFLLLTTTVVILILVLFFVFSMPRSTKLPSTQVSIPTPVPTNIIVNTTPHALPPVKYNEEKTNMLVNSSKNRLALSDSGSKAKEQIINSLGNTSGVAYSSSNIVVTYLKSPDLFQGMIKNINISVAKNEAVSWFLQKGFTEDDLCKLPLGFYLSSQISSQLKSSGIVFNPLPEGC